MHPCLTADETIHCQISSSFQDGLRSAQFEHTLLVTETGCDILTLRPEEDGKPHFMTSQT